MPTGRSYTVAVLAGLSKSASEKIEASSRLRSIDRDDFDAVLAHAVHAPVMELPFPGEVRIDSWWDFHPDALLEKVVGLARLVEARSRLDDPAEMGRLLSEAGAAVSPASAAEGRDRDDGSARAREVAEPGPPVDDEGGLLDSMLGDRDASGPGGRDAGHRATSPSLIDSVIREILEETGGARDLAAEDRWRAAIDAELCERLARILSDESLRRLEATWSGIRRMVGALDDESGTRILLAEYDIEALRRDVASNVPASEWAIADAIREQDPVPGERGVDLLLTDHAFDASVADQRALAGLASLGDALGVPVLAAATGSACAIELADEEELEQWSALQAMPGAARLGLCAPRYLTRAPYGPDGEPVEGLSFDEGPPPDQAAGHCWGSAAFLLGEAVVRAACSPGGVAELARYCEIEGLPIHVGRVDGAPHALGPMEETLTETRLEAWSWMGILPVTAIRGSDAARILEIRSLARQALVL
jgi:type VI secretion system protein ImpC